MRRLRPVLKAILVFGPIAALFLAPLLVLLGALPPRAGYPAVVGLLAAAVGLALIDVDALLERLFGPAASRGRSAS